MNKLYNKITSIESIIAYMEENDYRISDDINIVNIRSNELKADSFDDLQILFYKVEDKWNFIKFEVTTDPGSYYLLNPMRKSGTAIVLEGQYWRVWRIGLHKGKYKAFVQSEPIIVVRDNNKDNVLDIPQGNTADIKYRMEKHDFKQVIFNDQDTGLDYTLERGYFGINCHRASAYKILDKVGLYSAGCCVHKDANLFNKLIDQVSAIVDNRSFDATWINERSFDKFLIDNCKK